MSFFQTPPALGNQFETDRVLRSHLARVLPPEMLASITPELAEMGELAGGSLYQMQLQDRLNEPELTSWDAWGNRIDHIEVSPLWKVAARIAAEKGVVATAYERKHGALSRIHQMALLYLFNPSTDVYSCPLAMTDGAARTLTVHGNPALLDRAVTRLTSRDPQHAWTSGQWMTERTGVELLRGLGGRATVIVTHEPDAAAVADRVLHLVDGRLTTAPAAAAP